MNIPTTAYHYKDIALLPNKSEASSRLYLDPKVEFLGKKFKLPIVPSNMKCVIDENIARWFSLNDYFYIMHRFTNVIDFIKNNQDLPYISISIGVKDQDKDIIDFINESKYRVDVITIDVAHGHSKLVEDMIGYIKQSGLKNYKLIAGNVCTRDGYLFLKRLGVDAVKVGIGGGSVCSTKNKTGFTYPMYSCVKNVFDTMYDLSDTNDGTKFPPIIADGGIRENGDIAKAIHAGATMVMAGSIFSKLLDSPADIIDGHKIYFGSASEFNKGFRKNVEGVKKSLEMVPMTYEQKLLEITEDLQSSISYAGGTELMDIRNCKHIIVSSWEA